MQKKAGPSHSSARTMAISSPTRFCHRINSPNETTPTLTPTAPRDTIQPSPSVTASCHVQLSRPPLSSVAQSSSSIRSTSLLGRGLSPLHPPWVVLLPLLATLTPLRHPFSLTHELDRSPRQPNSPAHWSIPTVTSTAPCIASKHERTGAWHISHLTHLTPERRDNTWNTSPQLEETQVNNKRQF